VARCPASIRARFGQLFQRTQGGVLDFFNMFSGGSLQR
jgi:hypothetical protein